MVYPPEAIIAFHSFVLCFRIMKLNTELHFELCMFNQKTKSLRYEMNFLVRYSIQVCKSYYSIIWKRKQFFFLKYLKGYFFSWKTCIFNTHNKSINTCFRYFTQCTQSRVFAELVKIYTLYRHKDFIISWFYYLGSTTLLPPQIIEGLFWFYCLNSKLLVFTSQNCQIPTSREWERIKSHYGFNICFLRSEVCAKEANFPTSWPALSTGN